MNPLETKEWRDRQNRGIAGIPQESQSSEDWQEGVRLENRLRKIEERLSDMERLVGWVIVGYVSGIVVLAAIFLLKH